MKKKMDCIFCNIIKNQNKENIICEDEKYISIYDINPVTEGHALVIPKNHCINLLDAPDDTLIGMMQFIKKTAEIIIQNKKATGFNVLNANGIDAQQSVAHLHFHIIPRYKNDQKDLWIKQKTND